MYLYHYFERSRGPFKAISDLPNEDAVEVLSNIRKTNPDLVHPNMLWFLNRRRELEAAVRDMFIEKGGKPVRLYPHYMTVERADSMKTWYLEPECLKIDITEFNLESVSFTYGDMFPVFNPNLDDGREYRKQVYKYDEIVEIIEKYGYPQEVEADPNIPVGHLLKYVEAHIWSDEVIDIYRQKWESNNLS